MEAEENVCQIIGKLQPVRLTTEIDGMKTTILRNMTVVENDSDPIVINHLQLVGNSDGNMEINQFEPGIVQQIEEVHEIEVQEITLEEVSDFNDVDTYSQEEIVQGETEDYGEEVDVKTSDNYANDSNLVDDENTTEDENTMDEIEDDVEENDMYVEEPDSELLNDPDFEMKPTKRIKIEKKKEEEVNYCNLCQRSFKTPVSLKRHVTVCHSDGVNDDDDPLAFELCLCCGEPVDSAHTIGDIKCEWCDKLFTQELSLERHKSLEHSSTENWKCAECSDTFVEKAELIDHMQTHPLNKPFVCKKCNSEFSRKYHLERHIAQTGCDGTRRNEFQCQVCSKSFSRKDNLRDHLRAHAGQTKKKKIFHCMYCNKEFRGSAPLSVHLRTHTGEKPYLCDMCPKRFPSSGAIRKHRRMHTGEKPYQCPKCDNRFAAKETLNRHVRTHTGQKPHACQFCGKTFIQAAQLRAHIFHHTGENAYTCPHCNRAFNRRARLTMHVKFVHEGAQPLECEHCNKTFFRKEDLARHSLLHSGIKPFACEICTKSFAVKSSLKLHLLTHRKEQPCSCDVCGRAFIRQDCLLRHMRARHRDVLEDILAGAEKKKLQQQLLTAAKNGYKGLSKTRIWNELTLTDSVKELLTLLVDENTLQNFGWPNTPVDKLLDSVITRCGHNPASEEDFDYIGRMRENVKLLFTVVIDDEAVKSLLNNQTVDEVITHVLKLAKTE